MEESKYYYTYVLFDTRKPKGQYTYGDLVLDYEPFYIGKGKWAFDKKTKRTERLENHFNNFIKDRNLFKKTIVKKIKNETGEKPFAKIYDLNLTNDEAYAQEKELIKKIGRRDLKLGPLTNLNDGGEGGLGPVITDEWRKNHKKGLHKPSCKKAQSENMKKRWRDPIFREKNIKSGHNHPMKKVAYLFDLEGNLLKKFNLSTDCSTYLKTNAGHIRKVISSKVSFAEQYFISRTKSIDISKYYLTQSKNIKVKPKNKFIFKDDILIEKHCNRCNTYKLIKEFGKDKYLIHCLTVYCKECNNKKPRSSKNFKYIFKQFDQGLSKKFKYDENNQPIKKWCNKCKTWKPLNNFHKNKSNSFGIAGYCKKCNKNKK